MQKTLIVLTSDLDGDDADETVRFGLDGFEFEIDVTAEQAEELRDMIGGYAQAGRRVTARRPAAVRPGPGNWSQLPPGKAKRIRRWAAESRVVVNQYGRIPREIVWQYEASTGDTA